MMLPPDERTPPMTPQLALRVALVGGVALLLFAVVFFRLWVLQVLTGSQYVAQARSNVVQHLPVAAPRGEIVDSSGTALVQSVQVPSIQIAPRSLRVPVVLDGSLKLPVQIPAKDYVLFDKLAKLIGMSTKPHRCTYTVYWSKGPVKYTTQLATIPCRIAMSVAQAPFANVTIKTNVPTYIQEYIAERQQNYRGVLYQDTYVRKYALGNAGAQLFGLLGPVSTPELKIYKGVKAGDVVGQSGLEAQYNQYLQGVNGSEGVKVNSQNQFEGYAKETRPTTGDTLKLSLNSRLEQVGQQSLAHSIAANNGTSGAFIAMNPDNGQIYAMGSSPSYNPSKIAESISAKEWAFLKNPNNNEPLVNRAIAGALPDGSTFKVITATAALESGNWNLNATYTDTGQYCFRQGGLCLKNAGGAAYGTLGLEQAIQVSDDVFFYNLGALMNGPMSPNGLYAVNYPKAWPLQEWAGRFGIGRRTGVDLPGELAGEIGSPKLLRGLWKQERQCDTATGLYKGHRRHPAVLNQYGNGILSGGCGIASSQNWYIGDNVETGVGQFDDLVTPMQLAVVYGAIANGGKIVTPHLGEEIQSPTGALVQTLDPAAKRKLNINPTYLSAIQQGLYLAASQGTSGDVMGNFPLHVYGKTGTAEIGNSAGSPEHAWYACYIPRTETTKPIVVVVNVEKGGFGDVAAAPVARQILSQWFFGKPGIFKSGTSSDR
jgi:penicillin-binding protein 2